MHFRRERAFIQTVAAASALGVSAWVHAQHALGGGNALDKDLTMKQKHGQSVGALDANSQVGSGGVNVNAAKTDYFSRNLIVTGDVAGGRGFRGSVGYREQSEFTGQTGADDNRRWDAYSALSSPAAIRSGIDPYKATQEYGAVLYSRTYSNAAARDILTNQQPLDSRLAFDRFAAAGTKMARQADIIDAANTNDTGARTNWRAEGKLPGAGSSAGSGAAGGAQTGQLTGPPVDAMLSRLGLSTYERQRLKEDLLTGRTNSQMIGQVYDERARWQPETLADTARLRPVLPNDYDAVIDTMRQRAGMEKPEIDPATGLPKRGDGKEPPRGSVSATMTKPPEGTEPPVATNPLNVNPLAPAGGADQKPAFDQQLDWLRRQLSRSGPDTNRSAGSPDSADSTKEMTPNEVLRAARERANETATAPNLPRLPDKEPKPGEMPKPKMPDLDELADVLKHGQRIESLVPEDSGYIHDMMDVGAQAMLAGDFFRAEQIYTSVLRVIPGHPMALVGVANSNLASGLPWAAALTLRKLFEAHPAMIGTRFGAEVLPPPVRMETGLSTARARLRAASSPDAGPNLAADRYDYGLVIAYIGFQQDNPEIVREGLGAMKASSANDPLVKVLEHVWLPDAAPTAAPPAAEPAPSAEAPAAVPATP